MRWYKPNKYENKKTIIDNIEFDSKKESNRYLELKLLMRAGEISNLELQKKFSIYINNKKICNYIADFVYKDKNGKEIIEDTKGFKTTVYRLKKKMFEAYFKQKITET